MGALDRDALKDLAEHSPDQALKLLIESARATDRSLKDSARRLAGELVELLLGGREQPRPGLGLLATTRPAAPDSEVDLDRSIEEVALARALGTHVDAEQLFGSAWRQRDRSLTVLIDFSGSMAGQQLAIAMTVAAAAALSAPTGLAIVAFADNAIVLCDGDHYDVGQAVEDVLALRGRGPTDLGAAAHACAHLESRAAARQPTTLLISDCQHNQGPDPYDQLSALPHLAVLCPSPDDQSAQQLGLALGVSVRTAPTLDKVITALDELFTEAT